MINLDQKEKFIELRAKGWSFDRIAKELGRAKQTLIDWSKELQEEIANRKALELEALYETYYLQRESRLQTFGAMLTKIKEEVMSRDLSDVPTDKLLDLFLKYNNQIREEIVEPIYKSSQELTEEKEDRELLETKERFIELRAKGWSFDKIAKEIGKAKQTLIDWSKELQEEIANRKALELEALYETYYLQRESRLQMFGAMLTKIKKEVERRDLSDVPTDKLLELLLKYNSQVKEEIVEPIYKSSQELIEERQDRELLEELTTLQSEPLRRLKVG